MGFFNNTLQRFQNFFEISDSEYEEYEDVAQTPQSTTDTPTMRVAPTGQTAQTLPTEPMRRGKKAASDDEQDNLHRLHARQKELMKHETTTETRTTIDIKFPKRYEDAPEIVNLLLENVSVLIDFQYMGENQARRCLDYLDGARSVLAGNLKKVSSTMWLLTPVNVTVNIEELRSAHSGSSQESSQYDYDMRR